MNHTEQEGRGFERALDQVLTHHGLCGLSIYRYIPVKCSCNTRFQRRKVLAAHNAAIRDAKRELIARVRATAHDNYRAQFSSDDDESIDMSRAISLALADELTALEEPND